MSYIIRYEKKKCIGSGACEATNPEHFKLEKDGKAVLLGGTLVGDNLFEKEIPEEKRQNAEIAVMGCPPHCIHLIDKKTGQEIKV